MSQTNQRKSNFHRRNHSSGPAKGASAQTSPHSPFNTRLNSTSTKPYNNYSSNNYSNNKYTSSGPTQKNYGYDDYSKDDKTKDAKPSNASSKLPSNQARPSNDKASKSICYKCGKIGFARDCPRH